MRLRNGVVVALAVGAADAATQQILEVDRDAGRELVGGFEYSFGPAAAVDYDRRLVLVAEAAHPRAVVAYSLDDGSVQGVFGGGREGDGPGEIRFLSATSVGPDGVFVAGSGRVLYLSWSGAVLHQWAPAVPQTHVLCALGGRPAVLLQQGVLFRGDDGESVALGGVASASLELATLSEMEDVSLAYLTTRLACTDSAAYVLESYGRGLTEYKAGAEPRSVAMPAELVEAARTRRESSRRPHGYSNLFLAADGRLVATTHAYVRTHAYGLTGAVVDRATGCYALLKASNRPSWSYVGMFGDSLVTLEGSRQPTTMIVDGKPRRVSVAEDSHIFVRPVRSVSGDPCP